MQISRLATISITTRKFPIKSLTNCGVHSESTQKRGKRTRDKKDDEATASMAIDAKTRLLLYKMVNGGVLESINGIVATGKESVVFHAVGRGTLEERDVQLPAECAVKVFKDDVEWVSQSRSVHPRWLPISRALQQTESPEDCQALGPRRKCWI